MSHIFLSFIFFFSGVLFFYNINTCITLSFKDVYTECLHDQAKKSGNAKQNKTQQSPDSSTQYNLRAILFCIFINLEALMKREKKCANSAVMESLLDLQVCFMTLCCSAGLRINASAKLGLTSCTSADIWYEEKVIQGCVLPGRKIT